MPFLNIVGYSVRPEAVDAALVRVHKRHAEKVWGRRRAEVVESIPHEHTGVRSVGADAARVAKTQAAVQEGRLAPATESQDDTLAARPGRTQAEALADANRIAEEQAAAGKKGRKGAKSGADPKDVHEDAQTQTGTQDPRTNDAYLGPPALDADIRHEVLGPTVAGPDGPDFDVTLWLRGGHEIKGNGDASQLADVVKLLDMLDV